jgi:hypothetical protein
MSETPLKMGERGVKEFCYRSVVKVMRRLSGCFYGGFLGAGERFRTVDLVLGKHVSPI